MTAIPFFRAELSFRLNVLNLTNVLDPFMSIKLSAKFSPDSPVASTVQYSMTVSLVPSFTSKASPLTYGPIMHLRTVVNATSGEK